VNALKKRFAAARFSGVAGPCMRGEGVDALLPMESLAVMGFSDVLKAFPRLLKHFYTVRDHILKHKPEAVVLIDYPGFNLRLAKALRKHGYQGKLIQYICPSVWAHGRDRIQWMASTMDLLLTIYPFEAQCFADTSLPVVYVGNPLIEYLGSQQLNPRWRQMTGLAPGEEFVAIFPGSREGEIVRNLPAQLYAADALKQSHPSLRFALSCAHPQAQELAARFALSTSLEMGRDIVPVPAAYTQEMMQESRTALAKSGTVTLELALRQRPTIVTYGLTTLNKWIAKYLLRVNLPHYCIVNILGKQAVFPEFIDVKLPLEDISKQLKQLHEDGAPRRACLSLCEAVKDVLGSQPTSHAAAQAIAELLHA
jgi:lipid-A-disaccharide synthase